MRTIAILLMQLAWLVPANAPAQQGSAHSLDEIEALVDDGWLEKADQLLDEYLLEKKPLAKAFSLKARTTMPIDLKEAQEWAKNATKAAPDEGRYWTLLGTIKAFRIRQSPIKGVTLGGSSKKDFEKGVKLAPDDVIAKWALLRFHMYAPGIAGGKKERAREMAQELFAVDQAQGYLARAQLSRRLEKDMAKSRRQMEQGVAVRPEDSALCYGLAENLLGEGHNVEALVFYQRGAERDTVPGNGAVKLGQVYLLLDQVDNAQEEFARARLENPNNIDARLGQGRVLLARQQNPEAVQWFRKMLAEKPDHAPIRYYLALAMLAQEDTGDGETSAVNLLQAYLADSLNLRWPSRSLAHWKLALALEKEGRFNEAWQAISRAQELPGASDEMNADLKRIEFMGKD